MLFQLHTSGFNRIRRDYGQTPVKSLQEMYTLATSTLYLDLPSLITINRPPPNHTFLGPVLWEPRIPLPSWWNEVEGKRPLIYVTLGSSGDLRTAKPLLEALGNLPVTAVMATAGQRLSGLPRNVFVADYLPGLQVIKSAQLVISNGGSPTTYQALYCGVPVLGLPSNLDQYLMMESVVKKRAGLFIRSGKASSNDIRRAVETLLGDETYRSAASELQAEMYQYHATTTFPVYLDALGVEQRSNSVN
jgi:UDP:flavonoid glycosyltransferase YjiC (YdhE family)